MDKREEFYCEVPPVPVGDPVPINVNVFDIKDEVPDKTEIRAVVQQLQNGQAGDKSVIHANHTKG